MIVHALVEGPSEKIFFEAWGARFLKGHTVKAYPHQGKGTLSGQPKRRGLLDQLEAKLVAYGQALDPQKERVLVLIDADNDDTNELGQRIDKLARSIAPAPVVMVRFAVEELEAFYLADLHALRAAFPDFDQQEATRYIPDSICGTWELFGRVVRDGGGNKVAWARSMGPVITVNPARSRSPSFKELCAGLKELAARAASKSPKKTKPRRAKRAVEQDKTGKRQW